MSDMTTTPSAITPFDWTNANPSTSKDSPEELRETAQQFESILLGMMLKSMREASGGAGWMGAGEDQSLSTISELAEQQVAQALSSSGGLGLSRLIADGLGKARLEASPASKTPANP